MTSVEGQGKQVIAYLVFLSNTSHSKTEVKCQLDTGATCNVMSYDDLSRIVQDGNPQLQSSNVKLRLFDGSLMIPKGTASLEVENNNNQRQITEMLQFQVVKGNNKPLLSADTCEKLGLIQFNINKVTETTTSLLSRETLLQNYKGVFEGLGHIGKAKLVWNENCTPVQHAPRRIPVSLQSEVKAKIAELEAKGIIQKESEPTDWISSMVVVAKPHKIRICLDQKI